MKTQVILSLVPSFHESRGYLSGAESLEGLLIPNNYTATTSSTFWQDILPPPFISSSHPKRSLPFLCVNASKLKTWRRSKIKMSVHTRFAIEYPSNAPHTSIPIPTLAQAVSSIPEGRTERGNSFSSLWKGVCDFATRILKSKTTKALEEKNQILEEKKKNLEGENQKLEESNQLLVGRSEMLEEEAILMQRKLAEVSKKEDRTKGWLEDEVDRGTKGIEAVLKSQMDELHEKRMSELHVFKEMFERHEEVYFGYLSYKEGFDLTMEECENVSKTIASLREQNEELENSAKKLEDLLNAERCKVAMYEQNVYGVRGSSSNQQ